MERRIKELESQLASAASMRMNDLENQLKTASSPGRGMKKTWEVSRNVTVQGGSLRTWAFQSPSIKRVKVVMKTEGRPLNANVDLWQGPDNTPQKMSIYIEDASMRPFKAVIETPGGYNSLAVRNTGQMEFPLAASVVADTDDAVGRGSAGDIMRDLTATKGRTIQGGALHTYAFEPNVASVQVLLKTDGRPLNARIELLQGPNNNKQVVELYTEDGNVRPFFAVIETPGSGNVVRVVNTATVEFPMTAYVEPFEIGEYSLDGEDGIQIGENIGSNSMLDRVW